MTGRDEAAALRDLAPDIARSRVYLCGPDSWMVAAARAAQAAGATQLHAERFAW
jgi:ferredoxin-NADP reductase